MDKKFFVPFETALLLKKKGYNGICDYYYAPDKQLYFGVTRVSNDTLDYENNGTVVAPTYHEVVDWLLGKGYPIESACIRECSDSDVKWLCGIAYTITRIYLTREEALNEAIIKALEMI